MALKVKVHLLLLQKKEEEAGIAPSLGKDHDLGNLVNVQSGSGFSSNRTVDRL